VALLLKRRGISRVRPLAGGYEAWVALGYPLTGVETLVSIKAGV
jgi:3-mercaptopyruvate sulfurtransferase SseA